MDIFLAQMISMLSMVILIELSVLMMVVLPFCGTDIGWAESFTFFFIKVYAFWSWKILIIFQAHGLCLKPNFQPALNHRGLLVGGLVWPTSGLSHLGGQGRQLVLINTKVVDITREVVRPLLSDQGRVRTLGSITT